MKKNHDILYTMTRQYEAATKESEDAVSMVTTALNRLKAANQRAKSNMEGIEAYCANLMAVHSQLAKNHSHNEAVIANFSKLLCVEEDK